MNEVIEELNEEMKNSLKRAEHSVYVSLKYTRTVDVIKNLIDRYIATLSFGIDVLAEYLSDKGKIEEKPETLIERINIVQEKLKDETVNEAIEFLLFLRKITRTEYGKCEEFRRHVTMIVKVEGKEHNIDIDVLMEYFERMKKYTAYIEKIVKEIKNED